jgi:hypothetical protein
MAETVSAIDSSGSLAANSLLSTQLFIPQARHLPDVLLRPRLVEQLQAGLSRRLTLISAPRLWQNHPSGRVDPPE